MEFIYVRLCNPLCKRNWYYYDVETYVYDKNNDGNNDDDDGNDYNDDGKYYDLQNPDMI